MAKLKITLRRSLIGHPPNQRATVRSLGLSKVNQSVERDDDAVTRGMVKTVQHLVEVQPVDQTAR